MKPKSFGILKIILIVLLSIFILLLFIPLPYPDHFSSSDGIIFEISTFLSFATPFYTLFIVGYIVSGLVLYIISIFKNKRGRYVSIALVLLTSGTFFFLISNDFFLINIWEIIPNPQFCFQLSLVLIIFFSLLSTTLIPTIIVFYDYSKIVTLNHQDEDHIRNYKAKNLISFRRIYYLPINGIILKLFYISFSLLIYEILDFIFSYDSILFNLIDGAIYLSFNSMIISGFLIHYFDANKISSLIIFILGMILNMFSFLFYLFDGLIYSIIGPTPLLRLFSPIVELVFSLIIVIGCLLIHNSFRKITPWKIIVAVGYTLFPLYNIIVFWFWLYSTHSGILIFILGLASIPAAPWGYIGLIVIFLHFKIKIK